MADIKQAAKWMQEGKKVTGGNALHPLILSCGEIYFDTGKEQLPYSVDNEDLLAEDWEIAE